MFQEEAGAAGAVMMAAVQQGLYPDISAITQAWIAPLLDEPEAPDPSLKATYDTLFGAYVETRRALAPAWTAAAAMRKAGA